MANPNKTVAAFRARQGRDPKVSEANTRRLENSEFGKDLKAWQAGQMSAVAFKAKWGQAAEQPAVAPKAVEAPKDRGDFAQDLQAWQEGRMSAEAFEAKWNQPA